MGTLPLVSMVSAYVADAPHGSQRAADIVGAGDAAPPGWAAAVGHTVWPGG